VPQIFVEEYRKELSMTGYPFSAITPLLTDTGYAFGIGAIADASVYCESALARPVLSSIEKRGKEITFTVGDATGRFNLLDIPEVLSLYSSAKIFGGILVLNPAKLRFLEGWKDGVHTITNAANFCPRCIELVPPVGVTRIITDDGRILSGDVVISGGYGSTLQLLVSPAGVRYIETNFVGDPTYTATWTEVPLQRVICTDTFGAEIVLTGDEFNTVAIVACNPFEGNLFDDAFRIEGFGNTVRLSLGGVR